MNAKRIVMSLGTLVFVAAVVAGGTGAFFSDTETSEGNVFAAGAIDLKVSNESYYNGDRRDDLTWDSADLDDGQGKKDGAYLFFDYEDLKPGDWGEDTIDLVVTNNPAYACMDITLAGNNDNGITEPEGKDGDDTDGEGEGELQNEINFVWWIDDGDNVYENDEGDTFGVGSLAELDGASVAISDTSNDSLLDGPLNSGLDFPETGTYYIGKAWCYGELTEVPVDQDGSNDLIDPTGPQGPGVECDGSLVTNVSQSDSATVGLSFFAVQSRNNEDFTCSDRGDGEPEPIDAEGPTDGWNGPGNLIWQAEGRFGNNAGNGDWELGVGNNTQLVGQFSQEQLTWTSESAVPFTVSYDGNDATFTINGVSQTHTVGAVTSDADLNIVAGKVSSGAGDEVELTNLNLNGAPVNPATLTDTDNTSAKYLVVSSEDLSGGFTLTGEVEFTWTGGTTQGSRPAFQVQVRD